MELSLAVRAFEILLGWSLVLQSLEYLHIQRQDHLSDWSLQRSEIPLRPRWVLAVLDRVFQPRAYTAFIGLCISAFR